MPLGVSILANNYRPTSSQWALNRNGKAETNTAMQYEVPITAQASIVHSIAIKHDDNDSDAKHYDTSKNKLQHSNPTPFIPPVFLRIMRTKIHTLNT